MLGLGYEGDYVRQGIRDKVSWKGSIVLGVSPTSTVYYDPGSMLCSCTIDICSIIGNTDIAAKIDPAMHNDANVNINYSRSKKWKQLCKKENLPPLKWDKRKIEDSEKMRERITKLYFDRRTFPPPKNGLDDNIVFGHLRNYIELSAKRCGSPVVCNGNGHHSNERRFRCRRWYRRRNQQLKERRVYNKVSCTFTFSVKWGRFGYYIPLLENRDQWYNYGCGWHCCQ